MNSRSNEIFLGASYETWTPLIFSAAGYRVTLVSVPHLAIYQSRSVSERIIVSSPSAVLPAIRAHLEEHPERYRTTVLADDPLFWAAADDGGDWMREWFPVDLENGAAKVAASKVEFLRVAGAAGLPLPRQAICNSVDDLRSAARFVGYPVIVKGAYGFGGNLVRVANEESDLGDAYEKLTPEGSMPVVVQEFIEGESGASPVLFDCGKVRAWFSYFMKDRWPTRFSSSTAAEIVVDDRLDELVTAVGELIRFNGMCGIDWIQDPRDMQFKLIEFNPRPMGFFLGMHAGVNFARSIRNWLDGKPEVQSPCLPRNSRPVLAFPGHFHFAISNRRPWVAARSIMNAPWSDFRFALEQLRRATTYYVPEEWKDRIRKFLPAKTLQAY